MIGPDGAQILLSAPDVGIEERRMLLDAFDSNWIAPVGPHVDAFEAELGEVIGVQHAVALSSGSAALHLALLVLGIQPGDLVLGPTLSFAATANAVTYVGAVPGFIDSDPNTWNLDPELLEEELAAQAQKGRRAKGVIAVDLYGQCADYERLIDICRRFGVPLIEDAAEALGADYRGRPAGSLGDIGVLSFNGNKIITTSGGGMLVSDRPDWVDRARYLSTQARQSTVHYEHTEVGYNYRLSNLLAALGRAQLRSLESKVGRRRAIYQRYWRKLADLPGLTFMPEAPYGRATHWLTCLTVDPQEFGYTRDDIIARLAAHDVESRPAWKPMHLQPVFSHFLCRGGSVAAKIFERGLCLPSGSALTDEQVDFVAHLITSLHSSGGRVPKPITRG
jgi:dTDP-4-amino-4,6-dideoxygalactose transaminase